MFSSSARPADEVSRVFGCATMWHESPEEMVEMLRSIFRMDEDWSARYRENYRNAIKIVFKKVMWVREFEGSLNFTCWLQQFEKCLL